MKSVIAVPFARKLSGRTNYRRRLGMLKSGLPRLVVRKTLTGIIFQLVEFDEKGDKVSVSVSTMALKKLGWKHSCKNIPAAYLGGLLVGKMALAAKISSAIPDIGLQSVTKGGKVFAAIKGAKDAGLDVPLSDDVVPAADAISGLRIAAFAKAAAGKQFSRVKSDAAGISKDFESVRSAIVSGADRSK